MFRHRSEITLLAAALVASWFASPGVVADGGETGKSPDAGVAVVELFTSEGCSSCPPADRVLIELVERFSNQGRPVYCLSFHVDYWNKLGWEDPFSDRRHTVRQKVYARANRLRAPYTPQMIVNGTAQFVGSKRSQAEESIAKALEKPVAAEVTLSVESPEESDDDAVALQYGVVGVTSGALLNVAVVESHLETDVRAGENANRKLAHANVVRRIGLFDVEQSPRGSVRIELPPDADRKRTRIIAYIQDRKTLEIRGAADTGVLEAP